MDLFTIRKKHSLPSASQALPGRSEVMPVTHPHTVLGTEMRSPYPQGMVQVMFAMGCFWGVERIFWQIPGVYTTAVGYAGGHTPNPTYKEVCSGQTGHTEVVQVVFDPDQVSFDALLVVFWESHDPTQGMRQGNDLGTQYRSAIYCADDAQLRVAERSRNAYQRQLAENGYGAITTEIAANAAFYFAEDYHQQYLDKNPGGYCGIGGTGVTCAIGTGVQSCCGAKQDGHQ